ncbi:MAG TPA: aminoacyl-tRNA hydrolase [Candidatus Paceibacterota bacterium]|jgi:PTH1 family peptidyl-tRNA hydrolase|nr:aminoacyl-tRNA hydrolase [Candidatus Paceibacterota bacterium]
MIIIVGLGNPGKKYANNRHNIGFVVLDRYAQAVQSHFEEKKAFFAEIAQTEGVVLAKPTTFMNESGHATKVLLKHYEGPLVVVHDEINIPLGEVKCSIDRGSGDHNGVQSIIDHLGTNHFFRIRVGVRPVDEALIPRIAPPDGFEKFLLSDFTPMEEALLKKGIEKSLEIIKALPEMTFDEVMNKFNSKEGSK